MNGTILAFVERARVIQPAPGLSATRKLSRNSDLESLSRIASHSQVQCIIAKISWILTS
jgi:hypothetical protein